MRIALLTPGYGPAHGTLGRHVQALAEGAVRAGAHVEVLLHSAAPFTPSEPLPAGVVLRRFAPLIPGSDSALSAALWRHLRNRAAAFDVAHAHGEATLPALLALRDAPLHLVLSPHWYAAPQTHLRRLVQGRVHRLDGRLLARADRVLCVSHSEALQVRRHAPDARVEIVPNGLDTLAIAQARPLPEDPRVILSVDRLNRWAGIQRVVSALLALPPSYRLVVVGTGRGRSQMEAHADYLGVGERVRFIGGVGDAELYRWMHTAAAVATLKEESLWGATLLTALCAGTPVVASDIAANREAAAVSGGEGIGFVSRRASPFVIAEAIRRLADAGSRSHAEQVPSWPYVAARTLAVYGELLEGERRDVDERLPPAARIAEVLPEELLLPGELPVPGVLPVPGALPESDPLSKPDASPSLAAKAA
jgi:glycosyltransferase involved in cell wall biosynthesis